MKKRTTIHQIIQSGLFNEIDIHFARFIIRHHGEENADIFLAAALVSSVTRNGDVCLHLPEASNQLISDFEDATLPMDCPRPEKWEESLIASPTVGRPGQDRPLILDQNKRLYLSRYYAYEQALADNIRERSKNLASDLDLARTARSLARLFPETGEQDPGRQITAAAVAAVKRLCVISGGPGTGKTFTIAGILALLLEQRPFRIALAAPTGKAAARLAESVQEAKKIINTSDDVKAQIPAQASTIHRLLKPIQGTPDFRYSEKNRLPVDVLVVDEASMVDLALMSKMIQAVDKDARLILLGDRDQLASVEAGSVLGDICHGRENRGYSESFSHVMKDLLESHLDPEPTKKGQGNPLQDIRVILTRSYRFDASSGIGDLSRAVNNGDSVGVLNLLKSGTDPTVEWHPIPSPDRFYSLLKNILSDGYADYLASTTETEAIQRFNRMQILCALRNGPFGVIDINRFIEARLRREGKIDWPPNRQGPWYEKRPVMITRNDHGRGLYNGDIGITFPESQESGEAFFVHFPGPDGGIRSYSTHHLPEHETVYAMTVHKSQGSEFDHVVLVLPNRPSPLLTRELIYTAVTRARKRVSVLGTESVLHYAVSRKISRTSGLRDALWA